MMPDNLNCLLNHPYQAEIMKEVPKEKEKKKKNKIMQRYRGVLIRKSVLSVQE
jgi:hypothetical protein